MKKLKHKKTFMQVLKNKDNQAYIRCVLLTLVPDKVKQQVVDDFNKYIDLLNEANEEDL